jgi:hypothetical protein
VSQLPKPTTEYFFEHYGRRKENAGLLPNYYLST